MAFLAPLLIGSLAPTATFSLAAGALGVASTFALRFAGSLLLSKAASALAPKRASGLQSATVTVRQAVAPREIVYGVQRKGGVIIFENKDATNPKILDLVIVLTGCQVQKIGAIYFDGVEAIPDGADAATGKWAGYAIVERALGSPDQSAFPGLRASLPEKWTAAHRMRGCAGIRLRLTYSGNAFPSGVPNITADVTGRSDIYDPRTGTRGYTDNPALCLADYITDPILGRGGQVSTDDLIASANICDEVVTDASGLAGPRYRANGIVTLSAQPQAIIADLRDSMAGDVVYAAGRFAIFAGAYRASTLDLTEDDARDGGFKMTTRVSISENFNGVRGTFVSPENDWQPDDFPARQSSVYLAEDSSVARWADIELPFTTSASMAQRLAKIMLERQRRQIAVEMAGKLSCWRARVGDVVTLTRPRWGFDRKPFVVTAMRVELADGALVPTLTLRETSPLVYDWSATEEQIYAAAPRTALPSAFDIDAPQIVSLTELLYETRAGNGVKALVHVMLSASASAGVVAHEIWGARDGGDLALLASLSDGVECDVQDVAPGAWVFQARAINAAGVKSDWSSPAPLITYGLSAPPSAITGASVQSMGGVARVRWDLSPDLDVRIGGNIVIRHSTAAAPDWTNSVAMDAVAGSMTQATVALLPGAYLLAARDSSGILGPVTVLAAPAVTALGWLAIDLVAEAPAFVGTRSNVGILSDALQLADTVSIGSVSSIAGLVSLAYPSGDVAATGSYVFADVMDFGAVMAVRLRRDLDMATVNVRDRVFSRSGLVSAWPSVVGAGTATGDVRIEAQTTSDDPASGAAVWSDWQLVEAAEVSARAVRGRAVLRTDAPGYSPRVTRLGLIAERVA